MVRKLTELAENIKKIFWKLKCRKYRIFRSLIARYLAKSSGLWVVAYLYSENPFEGEKSLPAGDNCIGISDYLFSGER